MGRIRYAKDGSQIHVQVNPDSVLEFSVASCPFPCQSYTPPPPRWEIYVARNLRAQISHGDPLNMPGWIWVEFPDEPRVALRIQECSFLDAKLWAMIQQQVVAAQAKLPPEQYDVLAARFVQLKEAVRFCNRENGECES